MDDDGRIRHLLNPFGQDPPPRRAVVCPTTGLVGDQTAAPHLPEIHVLSEMCQACFHTEPRDASSLLQRAFVDDLDTAWRALRDDIFLGHASTLREIADPQAVLAVLARDDADDLRIYTCLCLLRPSSTTTTTTIPDDVLCSILRRARTHVYADDTLAALQTHVASLDPDTAATVLESCPDTARAFLSYPKLTHMCMRHPHVGRILCAHAASVPIDARYPPLALAGLLGRLGVAVDPDVATDTFLRLRKCKFDVRVAAAAASVAIFHADPNVRAMANVVESMAAHIQQRHDHVSS